MGSFAKMTYKQPKRANQQRCYDDFLRDINGNCRSTGTMAPNVLTTGWYTFATCCSNETGRQWHQINGSVYVDTNTHTTNTTHAWWRKHTTVALNSLTRSHRASVFSWVVVFFPRSLLLFPSLIPFAVCFSLTQTSEGCFQFTSVWMRTVRDCLPACQAFDIAIHTQQTHSCHAHTHTQFHLCFTFERI